MLCCVLFWDLEPFAELLVVFFLFALLIYLLLALMYAFEGWFYKLFMQE
jgi:hypothetical protein